MESQTSIQVQTRIILEVGEVCFVKYGAKLCHKWYVWNFRTESRHWNSRTEFRHKHRKFQRCDLESQNSIQVRTRNILEVESQTSIKVQTRILLEVKEICFVKYGAKLCL